MKINKDKIYIESFKEYIEKYPVENLLTLFNQWCKMENVFGLERHELWLKVRNIRPVKPIVLKEGTDAYLRLSVLMDYIRKVDICRLEQILENRTKRIRARDRMKAIDKT